MRRLTIKTAFVLMLLLLFPFAARAQGEKETSVARVREIQSALKEAGLDGWLFYDFRGSDPLAYRILKLDQRGITTRRWFYYVPATGEPVKLVHSIERGKLDALPGKKLIFLPWQQLHAYLRETLTGQTGNQPRRTKRAGITRRIAMQY
ncbi:MAG: hypothetical protein ICV68_09735, partial [Pyrinomonadaceae bacterium]|nr:hypothetical protein [Pyrinomonadaceae bacterium]